MSSTRSTDRKAPATNGALDGLSVILCAHGGAAGCGAAERHASRLLGRAAFRNVVACCLHGAPDLATAFAQVEGDAVVIVPMLMADGYTCRTMLPKAVAAAAPDRLSVCITPPIGTHPEIARIIVRRGLQACSGRDWRPRATGLLVAGHGTPRDSRSSGAVEAAAKRIAAGDTFSNVRAAFLEQTPRVDEVLLDLRETPCVVAGFFSDTGGHAARDLPALLAANHPETFYLGPIGVDPEIVDVVIERIQNVVSVS